MKSLTDKVFIPLFSLCRATQRDSRTHKSLSLVHTHRASRDSHIVTPAAAAAQEEEETICQLQYNVYRGEIMPRWGLFPNDLYYRVS